MLLAEFGFDADELANEMIVGISEAIMSGLHI